MLNHEWHKISPLDLPDDGLSELISVLSGVVPTRSYGEGLNTYTDFIRCHHATSWSDYYAALLLEQACESERNRSLIDSEPGEFSRTGVDPLRDAIGFALQNLAESGFWIPDVDGSELNDSNFFCFKDETGFIAHLPAQIAIELVKIRRSYWGMSFVLEYEAEAPEMMLDPRISESPWKNHLEEARAFLKLAPAPEVFDASDSKKQRAYSDILDLWSAQATWRGAVTLRQMARNDLAEPYSKVRLSADLLDWATHVESEYDELECSGRRKAGRKADQRIARIFLEMGYEMGRLVETLRSKKFEQETLKGIAIRRHASIGGQEKAKQSRLLTEAVINKMQDYLRSGKTASRAADLAFRAGIGTSPAANLRAWHRHKNN